jgi:hypothetical protein
VSAVKSLSGGSPLAGTVHHGLSSIGGLLHHCPRLSSPVLCHRVLAARNKASGAGRVREVVSDCPAGSSACNPSAGVAVVIEGNHHPENTMRRHGATCAVPVEPGDDCREEEKKLLRQTRTELAAGKKLIAEKKRLAKESKGKRRKNAKRQAPDGRPGKFSRTLLGGQCGANSAGTLSGRHTPMSMPNPR